ncbi:MAG: SPOR domain-containing protein, partial [Prevotellaceae bacterium]|nr:SPOR domain-containing protein [Prevotellaceae bacterium]
NNLEALITTQVAPQPTSDVPPEQGTPNSDPDEAAKQPTLPKADEPALVAEPPQVTPRCEFCTVVASFNTLEGARVKEQKYKSMGYKPRVVSGGNNRYRVMLGCYPTVDAAKKGLTEAAKFVKDAWVLEVCK